MSFAQRYALLIFESIIVMASRWNFVVTMESRGASVLVNCDDAWEVMQMAEAHRQFTLFFDEADGAHRSVIVFDLDAGFSCIVSANNQNEECGPDYAGSLIGDATAIQRMIATTLAYN